MEEEKQSRSKSLVALVKKYEGRSADDGLAYLTRAFPKYSANNVRLIWVQCLEYGIDPLSLTDLRGFKGWLGAGRCVRKGSAGIFIWCPIPDKEKQKIDPTADPDVSHFRPMAMFDIAQTDVADAKKADRDETQNGDARRDKSGFSDEYMRREQEEENRRERAYEQASERAYTHEEPGWKTRAKAERHINKNPTHHKPRWIVNGMPKTDAECLRVLCFTVMPGTRAELYTRYRELVRQFHPDFGQGTSDQLKQINVAYEKIKKYRMAA